ncbi:unnamed protein product [Psylliodes chrysocephalus]|uniref:Uncharacterized protein n=1 Tax=Psylliodes chrysocephalus TaxID=3402493 RepID=A0A9P0D782_9CUCU|nr:unnamed protein product [Psylliodes chrysocephala]
MANTTNLDEENPNHEEVPDAKENAASANNEQNESLDLSQINVHIAMPECVIKASAAKTKISNSSKSSKEEKEPNDELLGAEETIIMNNMVNNVSLSKRSEIGSASSSSNDSSSTSKTCSKSSCSLSSTSDSEAEPFGSDDSIKDPPYHESSSDESSSDDEVLVLPEEKENIIPKKRKVVDKSFTEKKVKKRSRNPQAWQKNFNKRLRNSGESYIGLSTQNDGGTKKKVKTQRPQKELQPPCG